MRSLLLPLILTGIIFSWIPVNAQNLEIDKTRLDNGSTSVTFKETLGSEHTQWVLNLFFLRNGVECAIIAISKDPIPSGANHMEEIRIECEDCTITFLAQPPEGHSYIFPMSYWVLKQESIDQKYKDLRSREAQIMTVLAKSPIRSITINGFPLPRPYPTPTDFANLFKSGLSEFPNSEHFILHKQMLRNTNNSKQQQQLSQPTPEVKKVTPKINIEAKELTIHDLITKPLGVMPERNNLWDSKYAEVKEYAETRANWANSSNQDYRVTLYGNRNYGETNATGYNMTYRGEPFFSAVAEAASYGHEWGKGLVENYSYSFERNITGKVPKIRSWEKDKILAQPHWTQQEAIAFAKTIVADLSSEGIRMKSGKKLKGDIYMMEGIDRTNKKYYSVRVFKADDKYSAFLLVDLTISSDQSYHYNNFKD
jgi:hypothetical protein